MDVDCDDGVACTMDFCDPAGFCRNPVDIAMCDDGIFCNGVEQCDPIRGCVPGPPESCNDGDVCTLDACDEAEKTCRHAPRDLDEDGEADWHCEGGTDCDDRDPTRGTLASEVCDDAVDNDCDKVIDEADCGRPRHDVCEDALDVSAGGVFVVDNRGTIADYTLGCGGFRRDIVLTFRLDAPADVEIVAEGSGLTAVALRTRCEQLDTEIECASGFPGQVRSRSLLAGTYYAIVNDSGIGEMAIEVAFSEPTSPPTNETCTMPADVSAGGSFPGSFVDVTDDLATSCGATGAPDLVYSFTTTETQNVRLSLFSPSSDTMAFSVRSTCDSEATQLRCVRGAPAAALLHELPAGTYFVVVEGPSAREVDFQLDVAFEAPSAAPAGDSCSNPVTLPLEATVLGSLADKQDDHETSCGFFYNDAVYRFTLTQRRDVTVNVDGGGTFMYTSIRPTCTNGETQLRCVSGSPSRARLRNLAPGTYYVVVESFRGTGFNISVETTPPTVPVNVSGNEACVVGDAHVVPATGGLFRGNTMSMRNDYEASCGGSARSPDATFSLSLTTSRRVVASTEGSSFDTVLHMHEGMCASGSDRVCDDDGGDGSSSLIDRVLTVGTYYYVVDGFGTTNSGEYLFEVVVTDP
jgi:hypothetical protein